MCGLFSSEANSKNIIYKTADEIEMIRAANIIVSKTLAHVGSMLKPGITGAEIDREAETFIRDHGGRPAFKGYHDFPSSLCVSVNETVVHGIPNNREFQSGDLISVDCGVELEGFFGDSAYTFAVGEITPEVKELLEVTYTSLYLGIAEAKSGKRIGDIAFAIQNYCERVHHYGVVRELVGHGVGKKLHEHPDVPNYGRKGQGPQIKPGLVIAIEPMVNMGRKEVTQGSDGWTINSKDGKVSAHYEHSIAITKKGPDILSNHDFILDALKNNSEITSISPKNAIFAPQNSKKH